MGDFEPSVSIKRLLGQADRELKRLIDSGEKAFIGVPPVDLMNSLLYYVARATSEDARLKNLRQTFGVDTTNSGCRGNRTGACRSCRAQHQAHAHGCRGDQGRSRSGEGRARYLCPHRNGSDSRPQAAARYAEEDRRHRSGFSVSNRQEARYRPRRSV